MIITIISGTNRPGSNTRKVSNYIHGIFDTNANAWAKDIQVDILDLIDLPAEIFSPSAYKEKPASFAPFKEKILKTDGILAVVPEYNGGFPGIFKYFIDMLPFPESLQKKPTSFVGLGDGRFGGLRGIEQLMMLFAYRNAHLFSERTFITDVSNNFDEATGPKSEFIKKILHEQVKNFAQFTKKFMA